MCIWIYVLDKSGSMSYWIYVSEPQVMPYWKKLRQGIRRIFATNIFIYHHIEYDIAE